MHSFVWHKCRSSEHDCFCGSVWMNSRFILRGSSERDIVPNNCVSYQIRIQIPEWDGSCIHQNWQMRKNGSRTSYNWDVYENQVFMHLVNLEHTWHDLHTQICDHASICTLRTFKETHKSQDFRYDTVKQQKTTAIKYSSGCSIKGRKTTSL